MRTLLLVVTGILVGCASSGDATRTDPPGAADTAPVTATAPATEVARSQLERARQLVDEAEPLFASASDARLSSAERVAARRAVYARVKEARAIYDAWLDAHPEQAETLDAEYVRAASMLYWVKKMAATNELG